MRNSLMMRALNKGVRIVIWHFGAFFVGLIN